METSATVFTFDQYTSANFTGETFKVDYLFNSANSLNIWSEFVLGMMQSALWSQINTHQTKPNQITQKERKLDEYIEERAAEHAEKAMVTHKNDDQHVAVNMSNLTNHQKSPNRFESCSVSSRNQVILLITTALAIVPIKFLTNQYIAWIDLSHWSVLHWLRL